GWPEGATRVPADAGAPGPEARRTARRIVVSFNSGASELTEGPSLLTADQAATARTAATATSWRAAGPGRRFGAARARCTRESKENPEALDVGAHQTTQRILIAGGDRRLLGWAQPEVLDSVQWIFLELLLERLVLVRSLDDLL